MCRWQVEYIGVERRPVLLVDDFMPQPDELVAYAGSGDAFQPSAHDYYPGVRKPAPAPYSVELRAKYGPLLREIFEQRAVEPETVLSAFSITTTPPDKLRPVQRVPHFDTSDPHQVAVVHYLCETSHGGTSFYRHRSTGYETITQDRLRGYAAVLKREVMSEHPPPPRYMSGDTPLFEQIARFEAQFNRALIYPSNVLHAGNIRQPRADYQFVGNARLTVNTFLKFPPSN